MSRQVPLALASPVYDHPRHLKAKKIGHVLTSQAFLPSRLGSPGVCFDDLWPKRAKKPQSGLRSQAWEAQAFIPPLFGAFWPKRPKNPKMALDDKLGKPRLVIPVRFGVFWPKGPKKPETDWDDKPRKPRLVIAIRFGVFWPKSTKKSRRRLG